MDVLAAFSGEEVSDLLHEGGGGGVGGGVALHLHLGGQEAADELDLLSDEILRLRVVEQRIVDPCDHLLNHTLRVCGFKYMPSDHLLAHVTHAASDVSGVGRGAQAELAAVGGGVEQLGGDVGEDGGGLGGDGGVAKGLGGGWKGKRV